MPAAALRIDHIAEYYSPEGAQWKRWESVSISLDPAGLGRNQFESFYAQGLRAQNYSVIALAFQTRPGVPLPGSLYGPAHGSATYRELLGVLEAGRSARGLPYLIQDLERTRRTGSSP